MEALAAELAIPGLAGYGLTTDLFADLIPAAQRAGSMKGNPILLDEAELVEILMQAR